MEKLIETMRTKMLLNTAMDSIEGILELTGGTRKLRRLIQTGDLAATVRTARESLKNMGFLTEHVVNKSTDKSNKFRREGNLHFISKDHKQAIVSFAKALAYAPNNSIELKLAYGNISAVLLAVKAYKDCKLNIEAAMESDCPEFLAAKLQQRKIMAEQSVNEELLRERELITEDEDVMKFVSFEVPRNKDIPCASADVGVVDKDVVAATDISAGTMVAFERAFVSLQDEINEYTSCYFCHKMCFFFIPCEGCCYALFCSKQCREQCWAEYHSIECFVASHMFGETNDINQHLYKLATRAVIKMSNKLTWEELGKASLQMGYQMLQKSSIADAFDSGVPTSLLCFDDRVDIPSEVMINRSLGSAVTVHWLSQVPGYLPEDVNEREAAIDALSRIILHLNTKFLQQIGIPCSAIDYATEEVLREVQRNYGLFSLTSKLTHSCEPNLLVVGFNDHVALVTLNKIKKGEKLTISYIEHFYDMKVLPCPKNSRIRQKLIFKFLEFNCRCRVCIREWHSSSQTVTLLTNDQMDAYNQYLSAFVDGSFLQRITAIGTALNKLSDCINTRQHRNLYLDLRKTLSICEIAKTCNKSYGCVQTLHELHDYKDYL